MSAQDSLQLPVLHVRGYDVLTMAPFPAANNTLASALSQHSLMNTSVLLQSSTLLQARTATPVGPSTQSSTYQEGAPATFSSGSTFAASPRTYIGIGPAIVTNLPILPYNSVPSSGVSAPRTHTRTGFISLVSLVLILFVIVGYLVWRRTRKRQSPARPPIRPRQKRSETARALAADEDPPPSLASTLPRDIIRAMNAAPGSSAAAGDESNDKHKYPPPVATSNKPSDPPYTYFSTGPEASLPPIPTLEITSPNSSAPSSPSPTTPTFSPPSLTADDQAILDRFSWDFKCKGKHCSADSATLMLSSGSDSILVEDDVLSSDNQQLSNRGRTEILSSSIDCEKSESNCISVHGEVFVLVPSNSGSEMDVGKELLSPGCSITSDNCTRSSSMDTSMSSVSSALLSALGLDDFDSSTCQKTSTPSFPIPTADESPRLEHIVAMDSFSLDIDFEPFHIQVVQSRPASSSAKEAARNRDAAQQSITDDLESKLQSLISTPRSASRSAVTVLPHDDDEGNGSPIFRPVLCTPKLRSSGTATSDLSLETFAEPSSTVATPKLDLVAETQIHSEEYKFFDCSVALPLITLTKVSNGPKTGYLRDSVSLPGSFSESGVGTDSAQKPDEDELLYMHFITSASEQEFMTDTPRSFRMWN